VVVNPVENQAHGDWLESPERVTHFVVLKFQTALFAIPLRVASDFEAESFVVAKSVFVF